MEFTCRRQPTLVLVNRIKMLLGKPGVTPWDCSDSDDPVFSRGLEYMAS